MMNKFGILMFATVGLTAIPLSHADSSTPADASRLDGAELEASLDGDAVDATGGFSHLRLVNTNLCLQPAGGTTDDVLLVLSACNGSQAQNWIFVAQAHGTTVVNQQSGKCIYNNAPLPLQDRGTPILQATCGDSNTLWKIFSQAPGSTSFMSRVQFRDTGFCLDTPNGNPFEGATMWMFRCNRTAAQEFIVE
jgi:hypothetical protein